MGFSSVFAVQNFIVKLGNHCTLLIIVQYLKLFLLGLNGCEILIEYLKLRASLFFLRYKPELIVLPPHCCETQAFLSTMFLNKQFDFWVSLTNCWIKFTTTEKSNDSVIHTTKACIILTKSITLFEAGYSSKTIVQQLAVVIWVVLVIFAHYLDKES